VLLRATGALALTGAAVMVINGAGRLDAEAPPQAALLVAKRHHDAEAASKDPARLISPAQPSQAAGDLLLPSAELGLWQPAAVVATTAIGAEPGPEAAKAAPAVDPALLAAAAKRASELSDAIGGRTSTPAETVQADEPVSVAAALRVGEASRPADVTLVRAYAPAEAPHSVAAEMTALLVAPSIPQARPDAPPARRQAARKSTRVARAGWPSDPPPKCGKKRARWRYVKDVPTWFCR
jgi:hypothetical protein